MTHEKLQLEEAGRIGSTSELIQEYETAYSGLDHLAESEGDTPVRLLPPSVKTDHMVKVQAGWARAKARRAARRAA